ncbi:hypothetical protein [Shewanella acanthi]|uniref:hypothetical protein n=1 Tax=Shewanella acanthi TaxID=2864212 RepID=UPI001C654AF5|nr:hypothetical protein [Shewanella acanthi]QYJ80710.1 hypothetical protein K0H61_09005 [Shewanella acanthi]
MADLNSKTPSGNKARFTPNMENFKVSLGYEGLSLKKSSESKSIADLKRKLTVQAFTISHPLRWALGYYAIC